MRCVCCDYCDTTGEMSPYKWGLAIPEYTGQFMVDPDTLDEYCLVCWINLNELYEDDFPKEEKDEREGLRELGGDQVEILEPRNAGRYEETDRED